MPEYREHQIQSGFVDWMRLKANANPIYEMGYSIPNGAHLARGFATMKILKAQGLVAGVPDYFFAYPSSGYHGLYLEFKDGKNKLTTEQQMWFKRLNSVGYLCREVRSIESGIEVIEEYVKYPIVGGKRT